MVLKDDVLTEEEGTLELGLDRIDGDIDRLVKRADGVIADTGESFRNCPACGLPTFMGPDARVAFCARCDQNYDVLRKADGPKLKKRKVRGVSARTNIILAAVAVGIMLLLVSASFFYFLAEDSIDRIDIHDVNDIRGLPIEEDVPMGSISQSELERMIADSIDDAERMRLWKLQRFFQCLLVIPDSWDLVDIAENESSGAGIAGFYDTEEEKMYIIGERHTHQYVNYVLSHEFTHALQDQNFDLDSYMGTDDYDTELARLCAIEGDAMMTMEMWAERNLDDYEELFIQFESLAQLVSSLDFDGTYSNDVLGEISYYPYEGGYDFVKELYDDDGWDAVNDLFTTRPPLSTEHIMHPAKYRSYEEPLAVSFDPAPENYSLRFTSVVGEKLFHELLSYSGQDTGAGAGWGGDRFYYYEDGGEFLSVMATRWDSELDNQRFADDMTMFYRDAGTMDDGLYSIRDNFLFLDSSGDLTTVYYGSSEEVVRQYMG